MADDVVELQVMSCVRAKHLRIVERMGGGQNGVVLSTHVERDGLDPTKNYAVKVRRRVGAAPRCGRPSSPHCYACVAAAASAAVGAGAGAAAALAMVRRADDVQVVFTFEGLTAGSSKFENEYAVLSLLRPHPNVIRFWAQFQDEVRLRGLPMPSRACVGTRRRRCSLLLADSAADRSVPATVRS
jgi:hypothetical protein